MQLPEDVVEDVRKRLRRVAGRFKVWSACLSKAGSRRDVVTQLSAASKALEQAGFRLVAAGLTYCVENPKQAEADGYPIDAVQKMFMKLA